MRETLGNIWSRAWVCLALSLAAFVAGGVLLYGAVEEIYRAGPNACLAGTTCHDPRGWVVTVLAVAGFGLFALGATTWVRAFYLVDRIRRRRTASV
jgi:hypothetical protein